MLNFTAASDTIWTWVIGIAFALIAVQVFIDACRSNRRR